MTIIKKIFFLILCLSCQKELKEEPPPIPPPLSPPVIPEKVEILNTCFKDSNYHVYYDVEGLRDSSIILGGGITGFASALPKIQLPAKNGMDSFILNTKQAGCNVILYVYVIHPDTTLAIAFQNGNCNACN